MLPAGMSDGYIEDWPQGLIYRGQENEIADTSLTWHKEQHFLLLLFFLFFVFSYVPLVCPLCNV